MQMMSRSTVLRYVLFFVLGYALSVTFFHLSGIHYSILPGGWTGSEWVTSPGRWVQHLSGAANADNVDDAEHTHPQHAQRRGKNHDVIREAFIDAIQHARLATVRLMDEDRQVALGAVVRADGWVISKNSELQRNELTCVLSDGKRLTAHRVATDDAHDLALLRIEAAGQLEAVAWGDSDLVSVGSLVVSTSTARTPLAIGVISVPPIDIPRHPGVMGIQMRQGKSGPIISDVLTGGAAAAAGLQSGDSVISVNGTRVYTIRQLGDTIRSHWPGDWVELAIRREDQELSYQVRLGRKDDLDLQNRDFQHELGGPLSTRRSGLGRVLQHDTVLTPEQCGGPLVDVTGHVIGINIARAERVSTYAIPASVAQSTIQRLLRQAETNVSTRAATTATAPN